MENLSGYLVLKVTTQFEHRQQTLKGGDRVTTDKVKEIVDDVFGVYYSEYMGQGEYTEDEAQEALDTALDALDVVDKCKQALVGIKEDIVNMNVLLTHTDQGNNVIDTHNPFKSTYSFVDKNDVLNIVNKHLKGVKS